MKAVIRKGYTQVRKRMKITVRRKDGSTYSYNRKAVKTRVRAEPKPDVGAAGKGPKLIGKLKKGMLTQYGYHPVEAMTNRHKSLSKGISMGETPLAVSRRLIAISTLTKRSAPRASRIYKQDAKWIKSKFKWGFKMFSKK